ncbi:unnamed protein product [Symbiodinium necroappetens]|uniref:Uncharacterized protein n=1 Tax=Symbiodinium necroappetens TaxID=1628268 RepID=A0A812TSU4_9DINO|nr:unnamed protein product [Symbiodinium necroappetens]
MQSTFGNAEAADPRRATAVQVSFEVFPVDGSNIQVEPQSSTNVNVRAGVEYNRFVIHALSGLGVSKQDIRAKLVPYDMRSTLQTCETVQAYMGFPFNGAENAVVPGTTPETIRNVFGPLTFPNGGLFRICYSPDGIQWQELEPSISVFGAESTTNKFWCPVTSLARQECKFDPSITGCECTGKVQGYKRNNMTDEFMLLGMPNPAYPPWRSSLTYVNQACGGAVDAAPFINKVSDVSNEIGFEIHNFGLIKDGFGLGVQR